MRVLDPQPVLIIIVHVAAYYMLDTDQTFLHVLTQLSSQYHEVIITIIISIFISEEGKACRG